MCGGIAFKLNSLTKKELAKFYSDEKINRMEELGRAQSFFWDKEPVLPVEQSGQTSLMRWGNRSKDIDLPKTGWAKKESLDDGKWNYLKPERVKIPAERGYEKGVWFDIDKGIEGIMVEKEKEKRVYMVTKKADAKYLKLTGHDREPELL